MTHVTENKPFALLQSSQDRYPLVHMRNLRFLLSILLLTACLQAQQPRVFDWVRGTDEIVKLDPMDFHASEVFRPGSSGGNIRVNISAKQPVTLAMTWAAAWNDAQIHPEILKNLEYLCLREHVVEATYECHLPPGPPLVLVLHDERTPDHAIFQSIGAIMRKGGAKQLVSPNDVQITYHKWKCVQNCVQPEYTWVRIAKEKYDLSSTPKLYSAVTPGYDGQQMWMKVKAQTPMTIALLPSKLADEAYDKPEILSSALSQTTCKQRGVERMEFQCKVNRAEGPQSLILVTDSPARAHKKAEIEFQTLECTANCDLIPNQSSESR